MSITNNFLAYFTLLEPPLIISEESILAFSRSNKPIPEKLIQSYFPDIDPDYDANADVEYIPCFQLHKSDQFHTLVYLRTALLRYEFYLLTLDRAGEKIEQRMIAGILSDNENVVQMAASFDENLCVHIAGAQSESELDSDFGRQTSSLELEILEDGTFSLMAE